MNQIRTQGDRRRHEYAYEKSNQREIVTHGPESTRIVSGHAVRSKEILSEEKRRIKLEWDARNETLKKEHEKEFKRHQDTLKQMSMLASAGLSQRIKCEFPCVTLYIDPAENRPWWHFWR